MACTNRFMAGRGTRSERAQCFEGALGRCWLDQVELVDVGCPRGVVAEVGEIVVDAGDEGDSA